MCDSPQGLMQQQVWVRYSVKVSSLPPSPPPHRHPHPCIPLNKADWLEVRLSLPTMAGFLTEVLDLTQGPRPTQQPSQPLADPRRGTHKHGLWARKQIERLTLFRVSATSKEATPVSLILIQPPGSLPRVGSPTAISL